MTIQETITIVSGGALGALLHIVLGDNKLKLPHIVNGELDIGFLGSIFIGAIAGYIADHNFITSIMAGYSGKSVINKITPVPVTQKTYDTTNITELIKQICTEEGVDPDLALRVARCESGLNPKALSINTTGSKDRGLYQINDTWHSEVTEEQAYDPIFSIRFFCTAVKAGRITDWNASKTCWAK